MGNLSTFSLYICSSSLLLFFPFALSLFPVNGGDCSYSSCAANMNKNQILYPFRTPDQPTTCGLPGFDLGCNFTNRTPLLTFASGLSFRVESISYPSKEMRISDPEGCLPEKLVNLNTSGTPFHFKTTTEFTLYSCPSNLQSSNLDPKVYSNCSWNYCRPSSSYSRLCAHSNFYLSFFSGCDVIGYPDVPGTWTSPREFTSSAVRSVYLNWDRPADCDRCIGDRCHRDPKHLSQVKCNGLTKALEDAFGRAAGQGAGFLPLPQLP